MKKKVLEFRNDAEWYSYDFRALLYPLSLKIRDIISVIEMILFLITIIRNRERGVLLIYKSKYNEGFGKDPCYTSKLALGV